jgi:hypothetical protein
MGGDAGGHALFLRVDVAEEKKSVLGEGSPYGSDLGGGGEEGRNGGGREGGREGGRAETGTSVRHPRNDNRSSLPPCPFPPPFSPSRLQSRKLTFKRRPRSSKAKA